MSGVCDIIIPTCRPREDVALQAAEIEVTAGLPCRVIATCQQASASVNRNYGLDQSESDPLIMVDDDMERFPQGWAVRLLQVLRDNPKCVMVSPRLARPDGSPGIMMGNADALTDGVTVCGERKLCTACIAIRRNALRFDEEFIGSGWEDADYCCQLVLAFPDAEFCVCHGLWIVHLNQMKNQGGTYWDYNKALYHRKWEHQGI